MSKTNKLTTRVQSKRETEANWLSAKNFTPLSGEIIIYEKDAAHKAPRIKIGDGVTKINELPFVNAANLATMGKDSFAVGEGVRLSGQTFNVDVIGEIGPIDLSTLSIYSAVNSGSNSIVIKSTSLITKELFDRLQDAEYNGIIVQVGEQVFPIKNYDNFERISIIPLAYTATLYLMDGFTVGSAISAGTAIKEVYVGGALGDCSFASGNKSLALGQYSHAEGSLTSTGYNGIAAHVEGYLTEANALAAHAEGTKSVANNNNAHAEGSETSASGAAAHAEGYKTEATSDNAHAEGNQSKATAASAHAEGYQAQATDTAAHAEGNGSTAEGSAAHAEGGLTHAYADYSHTEGKQTEVSSEAIAAHAEGNNTKAKGQYSHAEGSGSQAIAEAAHAEGLNTVATGRATHTEGYKTSALGEFSHAEGSNTVTGKLEDDGVTITGGKNAHAEGYKTQALGNYSHTEGSNTIAKGVYSHASGANSQATGTASFAAGNTTIASGSHSATFGNQTKAGQGNQFVVGKFNDNKTNTIFEVGIGSKEDETDESGNITTKNRKNAFEVYGDGHAELTKQGATDNSVLIKSGIKTINNQSIIGTGNIEIKPSVNPDWNQSDETAPDYIKNKTHGTVVTQEAINIAAEAYENNRYRVTDKFMSAAELIGCKVTYAHKNGDNDLPSYHTVEITADMITNVDVESEFAAMGLTVLTVSINSQELIDVYNIPNGLDLPDEALTTGVYAFYLTEAGLDHSGAGASPDEYYWVSKFEFPEVIKKLDEKYLPEIKTVNGESIFGEGDISADLGIIAREADLTIKLPEKYMPEGLDPGFINIAGGVYIQGPGGVNINGNSVIGIHSNGSDIVLNSYGGNIDLRDNNLVGAKVAIPTEDLDIANKQYVDTHSVGKFIDGVTAGEIFNDYSTNSALGNYSHAEGKSTKASGYGSHVEGVQTEAYNDASHAEGFKTVAGDVNDAATDYAHAEGKETKALGAQSHAEGSGTTAKGISAHAEGHKTKALGLYSHAGGYKTIAGQQNQTAIGQCNLNKADTLFEVGNGIGESEAERSNAFEVYTDGHAEVQVMGETNNSIATKAYVDSQSVGKATETNGEIFNDYANNAAGYFAHAEGLSTIASGNQAHTEGQSTTASGASSHAEGYGATATGTASHAEGNSTATADYSHAEGYNTQATAIWAHSEGAGTKATANAAHAEGATGSEANGYASHSEGKSKAYAQVSHAEGDSTAGVEGDSVTAEYSHAEGNQTKALHKAAHSEGKATTAAGKYSHAEGAYTQSNGYASHSSGYYTVAGSDYQTVIGTFNDNKADTIFEIGIGDNENTPKNALEVYKDGKVAMLSLDVDTSDSYFNMSISEGISIGSMCGISIDATGGLDITTSGSYASAKYNGSEIANMNNLIDSGSTLPDVNNPNAPKFFVLI